MIRRCLPLLLILLASWQPARGDYYREFGATVTREPIAPDGTQIQCDLPTALHMKNTGGIGPGGPGTGSGLCVFTSIEMCASFQNVPELYGWQKWMTHKPGGGYPQKVAAMIEQYCREKGVRPPDYIQAEEATLRTVQLALKTGRPVGITYCFSPSGRYGGAKIAHMVTLLHCDSKWACVCDNNFPGTYEWMSVEELMRTARCGQGNLWCVVLLNPGPPPPPCR